MKTALFATAAVLSLSACVTPMTEETAHNYVELQGDTLVRVDQRGPNTVVCQDYWKNFTLWDHAVLWPADMTSDDANAICRSSQQMGLEAPTAQPLEPIFNHERNIKDAQVRDAANDSVGGDDIRAY